MVASRRHLPDLRPELRGRQRRRHRRPDRRAEAPAVPGGPGSRRHLVHSLVRIAPRRRRVRRRRLPGHRPVVRVARRGGTADLGGPEPGHPDDRRHRSEPRFGPAPLVPGGPRSRGPDRRKGQGSGSIRVGEKTATRCPMAGCPTSRARPGRERTNPDGTPGEWYLHLFSAQQPDLNWSHPDVRAEHEAVLKLLVRPWRGRRPDRFGGAAGEGPGSAGGTGGSPGPASIQTPIATSCTRYTAAGGPWRIPTPTGGSWSGRSGSRTSSASPSTFGPTSFTPPSTSTSWLGPGTRRA